MIRSSLAQPEYQRMTALPEAQERALLAVPMSVLLKLCKWSGASDKYLAVQKVARELDEKDLTKLLAKNHDGASDELYLPSQQSASAEIVYGGARNAGKTEQQRAASVRVFDNTVIELAAGKTTITIGSFRDKILTHLRAIPGSKATLGAIQDAMEREGHHFEVKPVIAKLREAGWVK